MAGDAPDWTLSPPSQQGSLNGNGLFLVGTASLATGVTGTLISHTVPAGKKFWIQGLAYAVNGTGAIFSCTALLNNGVSDFMAFGSQLGETFPFDQAVPINAGVTMLLKGFYFGTPTPQTVQGSLWGWEQ